MRKAVADMETWAELLKDSPYIAIILALGLVAVFLFRRSERLQTKYTEDLVKATGALQDLTAEYLKQSFTDSAGWQVRYKTFEGTFQKHTEDGSAADLRLETKIDGVQGSIDKHETRIKEHIDRAVKDILNGLQR